MKLIKLLLEMPYARKDNMQAKFTAWLISEKEINEHYIIEADGFDLLLDDESHPSEIKLVDNNMVVGIIRLAEKIPPFNFQHGKIIKVRVSQLSDTQRGKGLMQKAYLALLAHGFAIMSDTTHTPAAKALWERLIQKRGVYCYIISDSKPVRLTKKNMEDGWGIDSPQLVLTNVRM
jgi:hypothetical protein